MDNLGFRVETDDELALKVEIPLETLEDDTEQVRDTTISDSCRSAGNESGLQSPFKLFRIGEYEEDFEDLSSVRHSDSLRSDRSRKILIDRKVFNQSRFDENFERGQRPSSFVHQRAARKISKYICSCSHACCKVFVFNLFPFLTFLKDYDIRKDISGDIVAGLTVGIMHIPQGMAYGMLTTLPPIYGLYMSFFPVIIYFFFGSSKHISVGTFSVACLMIGTTIAKGYENSISSITDNKVNMNSTIAKTNGDVMSVDELNIRLSYAVSLTFLVGLLQLLMGISRLGFVTVYLSDPLISGFTTGASCHVYTSQIKTVFGVKIDQHSGPLKLVYTYRDFFNELGSQINWAALIITVICLIVLYVVTHFINHNRKFRRKMFMPVPIELIVVVFGALTSHLIQLNGKFHVDIVGNVPTGLPEPSIPFKHLGDVVFDAISMAIVVFAISISMAKILAKKCDYEINANQELIAFGVCNIVSSFFAAPVSSASMSRSLTQERAGGKTQVAGLVSCVLILVVLLAIGPYFKTLPKCVLAAIIMEKMRGMLLQVRDLKILWRVSLIDFFVWIVSFLATVLLDVDSGLGVAVGFAIFTTVLRSQRPYVCLMGRISGTDIYQDIKVYKKAKEIPGIKIIRCEYSLLFVNAEHFRGQLYKMTVNPRMLWTTRKRRERLAGINDTAYRVLPNGGLEREIPSPSENSATTSNIMVDVISQPELFPDCEFHTIILDCSSWNFVDKVGVEALTSIIAEYKSVGLRFFLANCKDGIRETFENTKFYTVVERHDVYMSLHDAVQHAQFQEDNSAEVVTEASSIVTLNELAFPNDDKRQLITGKSKQCNGFLRLNYAMIRTTFDRQRLNVRKDVIVHCYLHKQEFRR